MALSVNDSNKLRIFKIQLSKVAKGKLFLFLFQKYVGPQWKWKRIIITIVISTHNNFKHKMMKSTLPMGISATHLWEKIT